MYIYTFFFFVLSFPLSLCYFAFRLGFYLLIIIFTNSS